MNELSHINDDNQPGMVDVGGKATTHRTARARATIQLPPEVARLLDDGEINSPKGPVFQTAIIAGTMAAKQTGDLIPLCHPIGLESCKINVSMNDDREVVIESRCEVRHKTGVEMEALTAATIAALTVYDMCKGVSRDLVISEVRLIEKTGGKSDYGTTGPQD